jgi:hypothetical protein
MKYPNDPGWVAGNSTSFGAAASMTSAAASLRAQVKTFIASRGLTGATCDECEEFYDMRHQTCSARCRELVLDGQITKTPNTRPTRSGRHAYIYVVPA